MNPPASERVKHPDHDWTQYPDADDACFIEANVLSACDDSKQSAYTMGADQEVIYVTHTLNHTHSLTYTRTH